MSVLIRDMEMPTSCATCKLFGEYGCPLIGTVTYALTRGKRHKDCPLIPIPPHGDLIDRDALTISTAVPLDGKPYQYVHIDNIKETPTIIPTDKSDMDSFIRIFEEDNEEDEMDSFIQILKD